MSTRFLFFSGKGGVGKTSMACTTAVREADRDVRTLIVTTDPASNLADVFEQSIGHRITPIESVTNLWAMEIDPDRATQEYIDRAMAPIREAFPEQIVAVMEEQMSGPCTAEVAAFDRFVDFIDIPQDDQAASQGVPTRFDTVIFDTAPTGHTLRLLELPAEWSRSIDEASAGSGQTCIGPAAAIQDAKHKYERALSTMRDAGQTKFIFVLQPEATSIKETARAIGELEKLGIHTHELIVNGIIPVEEQGNTLFAERRRMQQGYLAQIKRDFRLPERRIYLLDGEIKGVNRLREVAHLLFEGHGPRFTPEAERPEVSSVSSGNLREATAGTEAGGGTWGMYSIASVSGVLHRILPRDGSRFLFFTGKGGVGKTAVSCITAVWLARQGYTTLLLTTDPAAHVGDVLDVPVTDEPAPVPGILNLWATKIDPKAAGEAYKTRILDDARKRGRPEESIRVMEEELDSPCTEEMAAFDKFIEYAAQDDWQVTVFDTAPTGHTLRLLQLPVDWSTQLDIKVYASVDTVAADDVAKARFSRVIEMMKDPERSTFAYVMYPEATPIVEAYRASEDLRTIGIEPGLVVANQVLPAEACITAFSRARWTMQQRYLSEIGARFHVPLLQIPLLPREIRGLDLLVALGDGLYGVAPAVGASPLAVGV
jgi:arsenite/tail-anchored protein-transporting ATPase